MIGAGCLPALPTRTVEVEALGLPPATVEVCHTVGEQRDRALLMGLDGGGFSTWRQVTASVLIKHPTGLAIIDPDFGYEVARDIADAPPLERYLLMGSSKEKIPLAERLERLGISPRSVRYALLTHAHWDHAGAVRDLPRASLWLAAPEWEAITAIDKKYQHGMIRRQFTGLAVRAQPFEFEGPPYQGFAASQDLFGDGSVVAVPQPGHSLGSTAYFVNTPSQRLLFVGDTTWTVEGYRRPAHKSPLASRIVDGDPARLGEMIALLHALHLASPDLVIVPAHDLEAMEKLPACAPGAPPSTAATTGSGNRPPSDPGE